MSELKATLSADDFLTSPLNTLKLTLSQHWTGELAEALAACLEPMSLSYSWFRPKTGSGMPERWTIQWLMDFNPDVDDLQQQLIAYAREHNLPDCSDGVLILEPVPDVNWLEKTYQQFAPFSIGPFLIYGSHSSPDIAQGQYGLMIDAATAFGSGDHGTTRGCLEMLAYLREQGFKPKDSLDMGTGSGILGIGAYHLWKHKVMAIDNDPEAVRVAALHRDKNAVPASAMLCAVGDGYNAREVQQHGAFDLVIANILAGPLIQMADACAKACAQDGRIVLSGLLETQADDVLAAHVAQGLKLDHKIIHDEWATLLLKR